jgi:hypothetical protein
MIEKSPQTAIYMYSYLYNNYYGQYLYIILTNGLKSS